jgi:hypothetical protein
VNLILQYIANAAFDGKGNFTNYRVLLSEYKEYQTNTDDF